MVIKTGQLIPISLQLFDGREDMNPIAKLFSDAGQIIAEFPLVHFGGGLYLDKSYPMPDDTKFIIAQYHVRKNGRPDDNYEITTDTFYAVQPEPKADKFALGRVIDEKTEGIIGHVSNEIESL